MENLEGTLDHFIGHTQKSKVALIIPLFGYWIDIPEHQRQLDKDTLLAVLDRVNVSARSNHQLYVIFVAQNKRVPNDIRNLIATFAQGGHVRAIEADGNAYGDYIKSGLDYALQETDAQYVCTLNPWVMIQHGGIEVLIDRVNIGDDAMMICGYDYRSAIQAMEFDTLYTATPNEFRALNFDFCGMTRAAAEMLRVDGEFKTHNYLERDTWQTMMTQGYQSIVSQRVPIFSFEIDWKLVETPISRSEDREKFLTKWKFEPSFE